MSVSYYFRMHLSAFPLSLHEWALESVCIVLAHLELFLILHSCVFHVVGHVFLYVFIGDICFCLHLIILVIFFRIIVRTFSILCIFFFIISFYRCLSTFYDHVVQIHRFYRSLHVLCLILL